MIDLTVNESQLRKAVQRAREKNIVIPTFRQMKNPAEHTPAIIKDRLRHVGLWDVDSANLFRITWKNEPVRKGGLYGGVNYIEIPSCVSGVDARIIALDEPTSSLSHSEVDTLFRLVKDLRAQGTGMIYISHRLDEIFELCDDCSILRDGCKVAEFNGMQGVTKEALVARMVGREIRDIWGYRPRAVGPTRLEVRELEGHGPKAPASFKVAAGEIVGFFGLVGSGRSELMRLIYGAEQRRAGELLIDGQRLASDDIPSAIRSGIALCPEDRKEEGIIACRSVAENINISCRRHYRRLGLFTNDGKEAENARQYIDRLKIRTPSARQEIRLLSGGNQQKAVLARWLAEQNMRVLIVDEPTRGIDVGAKHEIYSVLYELAERGMAIVMVSSELPEVMGVADRILVMRQGRLVGEVARDEASEARILELALPVDSRIEAA